MSRTDAAFLLAAALLFIALRYAVWYGLRMLERLVGIFMPGAAGHRLWAAARPLRRGLEARHPRLYRVLRARLDPRSFAGLPLLLMAVAALYAGFLFAGLIEDIVEQDAIVAFDDRLNEGLAAVRSPVLFTPFTWVTDLGSGPALAAVALVATGFLWAERRLAFIAPLWLAFLGAQLTVYVGKFAVGRTRPEFLEVATASLPSFPSGHTTGAMAVYGFVAYSIARDLPSFRLQFELAYWTGVIILLVGFSRMFLGVHFLSDVLGGFLVGGFWLLAAFALTELARSRAGAPPAED
jgi:membrane-associated phospholipid phosphatase